MFEQEINRVWLKSYDPNVAFHQEYESIPLFEFLDRSARELPHRTAVAFQNVKITYARLQERVNTLAANLVQLGLKKGDRVGIMLPNLPQTVISFWAVLKAGGVVVMTNPLYMEKELVHQFTDSQCRMLIALDRLWPRLHALESKLGLEKLIFTSVADSLAFPLNLLYKLKARKEGTLVKVPVDRNKVYAWKDVFKRGLPFEPARVDPARDLALLQYTGGTTGKAKGVKLTHENVAVNVQQCRVVLYEIGTREVFLCLLPFFHVYGLTVCLCFPASLGATIAPYPQFVPQEVLKAIDKLKPTIFPSAPAVFNTLLEQKNIRQFDLKSIRICVTGSAPMPVDLLKRFKEMTGAEIIEGYGLTEASPVTHFNPLRGKRKIGSIGLPFPDTDPIIVDIQTGTRVLPPGEPGELAIKGPQVMQGYLNRPDENAETLREGWLFTGDIATMDAEGYFFIVDRKKDLIISGGFNVYPREIEEVLYEHPKVLDAACVGIGHQSRGETIKAYVVPKEGQVLEKKEVVAFCRSKLAGYKVPRQVEIRDELPKTIVGKVLRRDLKEDEQAEG